MQSTFMVKVKIHTLSRINFQYCYTTLSKFKMSKYCIFNIYDLHTPKFYFYCKGLKSSISIEVDCRLIQLQWVQHIGYYKGSVCIHSWKLKNMTYTTSLLISIKTGKLIWTSVFMKNEYLFFNLKGFISRIASTLKLILKEALISVSV